LDTAAGVAAFSTTARTTCGLRVSVGNFASCSFKRARTVEAALAAAAVLVALLRLFDAAAFRLVALTGFFAALDLRAVFDVARFRFESFSAVLFAFARIVLLAFRVIRVFDAGLLLLTRLRALDEGAAFGLRFDLGFAVEADPAFFVFELVVFFDLLRAAIANLSTREHSRTRSEFVHERCSECVHEYCSSGRQVDFSPIKSHASQLRTRSDFHSTINLWFSTNPSKNQRGR